MASAPPFVCPHAKLRSLPRGSPATGLATVTPSAKAHARGSADLMNFYATSYAVAYGQSRFRPCLGRHTVTGYVSNNRWDMSCLLCAAEGWVPLLGAGGIRGKFWGQSITTTLASHRSHCQDAARSTTAEHFQPLMLPDGRSLLPRHVHQPGSGYLQASSLSCLRTRTASPQHLPLLQGPPNAHREHGTGGRRAGPAQPDVLQKTTVGTKEQSGFTRATPRSDSVLPGQPVSP
ncbi:PPR32 phosphatase, partial [Rissa tridactyla]|nr:PPR32 phosphatase [Rissa tridactyla]